MSNFLLTTASTPGTGEYGPIAKSSTSPVPFLGGPEKAEMYDFQGDGTATGISVLCNKIRVVRGVIWSGNPLTAASWASDGAVPPTVSATTSAAMTSGKHGTLIIFGR